MKTIVARCGLALAPTLLWATAQAQTSAAPVDAGKALQESRPALPPAPRKPLAPQIDQQEDTPLALPPGQTLKVLTFRFDGAEFIAEADLQAVVAPFTGRALSMAEINTAADRITALYRSRGYLVARAYVPRQNASGGTLTLRIVIGRYGKVTLRNQSSVRDAQLGGYFAALADRPITRDELERAMLLVGELPGATLPKVSMAPGEAAGTSDLDIVVDQGRRYGGYATLDNHGSRYTGRNRLSVGASLYSPFHLGDTLDFSGMGSDGAGLRSGRLAYSAPLGSHGLRGELALGSTRYTLGDSYASLDAHGQARTVETSLFYPVRRTRQQTLTATLGFVDRELRDELRSAGQRTTRHLRAATAGLAQERYGTLFGRDAYASLSGSLTVGRLDIDEPDMKAANQAGANSVGRYGRASLSASGRIALTDTLSASASMSVQRAIHRNLDSSEQFSISGTRGVTAYREAISGDNGHLLHLELRHTLPAIADMTQALSLVADAGQISLHDASYAAADRVDLSDVGLGYSLSWRTLFVQAQVALVTGQRPVSLPRDGRVRGLLQAGAVF